MTILKTAESIYVQLKNQKDLTPNNKINSLFRQLVALATSADELKHHLSPSEAEHLREICSRGEYELELFWARKIIESKNPRKTLRSFPYYDNYHDLTKLEWFSVRACQKHRRHKVLFCGGGPLPMTAIMLALEHGIHTTVIDIDKTAVELSQNVLEKLKLHKKISVQQADGLNFKDYGSFNVIFLAALVGGKNLKEKIFKFMKSKITANTHVIARSSWGNRKLLYRPLPKSAYEELTPVLEVNPHNDIVNSFVIFEKKR